MRKLVLAAAALLWAASLQAQTDFGLYQHRDNVFQALYLNPAFAPRTNVNIGIWGVHAHVESRFAYSSLVEQQGGNWVITNSQIDGILDSELRASNRVFVSSRLELLNMGFRADRWFISLMPAVRSETYFQYSDNLMEWLWRGNARLVGDQISTVPLELQNIGVRTLNYVEIPVGLAYEWDSQWTFGLRVKYLQGVGYAQTQALEGQLTTDPDTGLLGLESSRMQLRVGGLAWAVDPDNFDQPANPAAGNWGLGLDLGATYDYSDQWTFSASLTDLGFISWGGASATYTIEEPAATLPVASINEVLGVGDQDPNNPDQLALNQLADSLGATFSPERDATGVVSGLTARFMGSAQYHIDRIQRVEATLLGYRAGGVTDGAVNLSYTARLGKMFSVGLNSTYTQRRVYPGFSMAANTYAFQLYMMTDNFMAAFQPQHTRMVNVRVGMNVALGSKSEDKIARHDRMSRRQYERQLRLRQKELQDNAAAPGVTASGVGDHEAGEATGITPAEDKDIVYEEQETTGEQGPKDGSHDTDELQESEGGEPAKGTSEQTAPEPASPEQQPDDQPEPDSGAEEDGTAE